jgi:acetyltransferase
MEKLFDPQSIAIVGFSARPGNPGQGVLSNLQTYGYRGQIHLVGRSGGEYEGLTVSRSVDELPDGVDLAVIMTSAAAVPDVLEACGRRGIPFACIESAGFDEFSPEGPALTGQLREIAHRCKIRFTGPNGFGVVSLQEGVFVPFGTITPDWMGAGRVSLLSQSGGLLYHIGCLLTTSGLGLARGVSMGNKADLNEVDLLPYLLDDTRTDVIWLYLEGFADGRRLLDLARSSAKPILMLKSGRTPTSRQALQSHSAALSTDDRVVSAMARQANVIRVDDFQQMVDITKAFSAPPVKGNQLLVFTRSGGTGVMAVDEAEANGFHLMDIPDWFADEVRRCTVADVIRTSNPVDLVTIFDVDSWLHLVTEGTRRLQPDAVVMSYIYSRNWTPSEGWRLAEGLRDLIHRLEIPVLLVVSAGSEVFAALERDLGHPVYREIGAAIQSLAAVRDWQLRSLPMPYPKLQVLSPSTPLCCLRPCRW